MTNNYPVSTVLFRQPLISDLVVPFIPKWVGTLLTKSVGSFKNYSVNSLYIHEVIIDKPSKPRQPK